MDALGVLRPLWSGPQNERIRVWLTVVWIGLLVWGVPFAVIQVSAWLGGHRDSYPHQHATLAIGSVNGVLIALTGIAFQAKWWRSTVVLLLATYGLLVWEITLL